MDPAAGSHDINPVGAGVKIRQQKAIVGKGQEPGTAQRERA
jgi:hypothetical protein